MCIQMAVMNKYMFAIAMENDFYPHYVTEKVYHALRSKCIPLFLGAKEVDQVRTMVVLGVSERKLVSRMFDCFFLPLSFCVCRLYLDPNHS